MADYSGPSLDARGRRKSSPAADEFYSRSIHSVADPDGALEGEINRLAKRYCKEKALGAISQQIALKGRLVSKCMRFYYVSGRNVGVREDGVLHEGDYAQIDDVFIDALMKVVDGYDAAKGLFTHELTFIYSCMLKTAAYDAAKSDSDFGGGKTGAPIMLDAPVRRNDDGSTTVGDLVKVFGGEEGAAEQDDSFGGEQEEDLREVVSAVDALEESGRNGDTLGETDIPKTFEMQDDAIDTAILLETLSLITGFLGKSGRAANDARKLYTRMFFSETLTRITKVRTEGELAPLQRQEKGLFGAVELPFQDTYTAQSCRTIIELWSVAFVDGIPPIERPLNDDFGRPSKGPDYGWTLPAKVYIAYLRSLGRAASDALVSQQRSLYIELLNALKS